MGQCPRLYSTLSSVSLAWGFTNFFHMLFSFSLNLVEVSVSCSFFLKHFNCYFKCVCLYMSMRALTPWGWSYKWLGATPDVGAGDQTMMHF